MMLMFHDDDCGELLDQAGRCPMCDFHPDMQSTAFKEVPYAELQPLLAAGRTFLGTHRTPVAVKDDVSLTLEHDMKREVAALADEKRKPMTDEQTVADAFLQLLRAYENDNETVDDTGVSRRPPWIRDAIEIAERLLVEQKWGIWCTWIATIPRPEPGLKYQDGWMHDHARDGIPARIFHCQADAEISVEAYVGNGSWRYEVARICGECDGEGQFAVECADAICPSCDGSGRAQSAAGNFVYNNELLRLRRAVLEASRHLLGACDCGPNKNGLIDPKCLVQATHALVDLVERGPAPAREHRLRSP